MPRITFNYIDLDHECAPGEKHVVLGLEPTAANEEVARRLFVEGLELPDTFFPPQGSVSLHEDEDNELYDPAKDPSLEKEEQEPIPF